MPYLEVDVEPLVRPLPNYVARGSIVATKQGTTTTVAPDLSATKPNRVTPHHLGVLPTDPARSTGVGVVVVVGLLVHPQPHSIRAGQLATAPCEVLTVLRHGVHHVAIADVCIEMLSRESRYLAVPCHGTNAHLRASRVVGV